MSIDRKNWKQSVVGGVAGLAAGLTAGGLWLTDLGGDKVVLEVVPEIKHIEPGYPVSVDVVCKSVSGEDEAFSGAQLLMTYDPAIFDYPAVAPSSEPPGWMVAEHTGRLTENGYEPWPAGMVSYSLGSGGSDVDWPYCTEEGRLLATFTFGTSADAGGESSEILFSERFDLFTVLSVYDDEVGGLQLAEAARGAMIHLDGAPPCDCCSGCGDLDLESWSEWVNTLTHD